MTKFKNIKVLLVANVAKEHVLKFHVPTIKRMTEMGAVVDVACSGEEYVPYCRKQFKMKYQRSPFNFDLFKGIFQLKKIIAENNYDIIYCHTPVGGLAGRIASISARKNNTKVVYFAHGFHFYNGAPLINWLIYYPIEYILSFLTDKIIVSSEEDLKLARRKFSCPVYLSMEMGVNLGRFSALDNKKEDNIRYREKLNIPENAIVLLYLAEIIKNKNQILLLRALKKLLDREIQVYLVLAGVDHSGGKLEKIAKKMRVFSNVRFLGWRSDTNYLLNMADYCTASSIREGFGINIVEAMASSLPVIASNNRGHRTIIRNGVNGYLVDCKNEDELVDVIDMLEKTPDKKKAIIEEAKNNIYVYSEDYVLDKLINIILAEK